jgi:hypothetical protein
MHRRLAVKGGSTGGDHLLVEFIETDRLFGRAIWTVRLGRLARLH